MEAGEHGKLQESTSAMWPHKTEVTFPWADDEPGPEDFLPAFQGH